ncbi:hypothetical protein BT63DRAFT_379159 [Microthyrium microscopicum]|uniref:SWI/SNF family DNA-dependent ATPase Ris1 n=1 Tax=Microthyrium microscopicum TaxID=703497 RepID=A0A6A6TWM3_9PEZI|nr:hypothetical protein BT63DRAFT_379159 [Microthyrium microscopicum]
MDRLGFLYADNSRTEEDIKKLMDNIRPDEDLPPELRKGTPDSMSTALMEHQKLGLTWLSEREEKVGASILADDMGLGKTIQTLALMVSRKSDDPARKTNLIVAPVALLRQWESEIEEKLNKRHALSVYRMHGVSNKRVTFNTLRGYDVVMTTYGGTTPRPSKFHFALLGDECKWYRVVLDEGQNIKNKSTKAAKAAFQLQSTYRLVLTGTPMQNNIEELWPLLHFCRLRPYSDEAQFKKDISYHLKATNRYGSKQAMERLQVLLRSVMLRRTKTSTLDGKLLITLPELSSDDTEVTFGEEEDKFYRELEEKAQVTVKNMIARGTLGKKYSNALTLLLRLRQACCHESLVYFSESALTMARIDAEPEMMLELAKELTADVVGRVKNEQGAFECPICMDACANPAILLPCGHWTCGDCFVNLRDTSQQNETAEVKCPVCRGLVNPMRITDFQAFKQVHQPDLLDEAERAQLQIDENLEDSGSDSDEDSDTDSDEDPTLNGAKITKTIEIVQDLKANKPQEKILIFSQFTSLLDLLEVGLDLEGFKLERYDGTMSTEQRAVAVEKFRKDPAIPLMLISLKAGNAGLNLNFASQIVMLDPFWNPYVELQAHGRAHRIGQRLPVQVHRVVVPGTVEDRILALQAQKKQTIDQALDEGAGKSIGRLGTRELAYLFGLDQQGRVMPQNSSSRALPSTTVAGPSNSRALPPTAQPARAAAPNGNPFGSSASGSIVPRAYGNIRDSNSRASSSSTMSFE